MERIPVNIFDPKNTAFKSGWLDVDGGAVSALDTDRSSPGGLYVAPGFIDIHMHEDPYDPETDTLTRNITRSMVLMGVTTALGGNCGSNNEPPDLYLDAVDRHGTACNLALMAGHSTLRHLAGGQDKYATVDDGAIEEMVRLGEQWLEAGCFGVSFGVKYIPGTRW